MEEYILTPSSINNNDLISNWKFHSGSGNILYDHSGNQNHGTIVGATWEGLALQPILIPENYSTIQEGIDVASDGDTILVGPGTYIENIIINKNIILKSVQGAEATIIDGNNNGTVVMINQHSTSEYYGYPDIHADVVLDGFTIQGGNSTETDIPSGGIVIGVSNSIIKNCKIINNTSNDGGGAFAEGGSFIDCIVMNNSSNFEGGGIKMLSRGFSDFSSVSVEGCLIAKNTCGSGSGLFGQFEINKSTIVNNFGSTGLAPSGADAGPSFISNSIFYGNEVEGLGSDGAIVSYSLIEGGYNGTGNLDIEPGFIDSENDNYGLIASSMLINAGNPNILDEDGTITDIGAFHYNNTYSGPTWFVSVDGDDLQGDGSIENPFESIQAAINFSENGDSVDVSEGTYFEFVNTRYRQIDIVGRGMGSSIIDGMNLGRPVLINNAVYFAGFTIQNANVVDPNDDRGGGMLISGDGGATIENCLFTDNYCAQNGDHLKFGTGAPNIIKNCIFQNNNSDNYPIHTDNGGQGATLINCFIDANNSYQVINSNGYPSLINCTVVNYTNAAYTCFGNGQAVILGSIFQPSAGYENAKIATFHRDDSMIDLTVDYNITPQSSNDTSIVAGGVITYGLNNIYGDPLFADTSAGDYNLSNASPAIGSSFINTTINEITYISPSTDLLGQPRPRPNGSQPDMGAYESSLSQPLAFIPDDNFEQALIDLEYDDVLDDYVQIPNIAELAFIDLSGKGIIDLTGIEHFTNLQTLYVNSNQLESLDISFNTDLIELRCQENQLSSLEVYNNTQLQSLACQSNQVSALDLSQNPFLVNLEAHENLLSSIDLSSNVNLQSVNLNHNNLSEIDVSMLPNLGLFRIGDNQISTLDVTNNLVLYFLDCYHNQLSDLDLTNNIALTELRCQENQLSSLEVNNNTQLQSLACQSNQIPSLDLSQNTSLQNIEAHENQLIYFDLRNGVDPLSVSLKATNNPELFVIFTLDTASANVAWTYDNGSVDEQISFNLHFPPTTQNLEFSTPEDTPYNGNMLGFDEEDQNLIYSIVDQPSNGVITNLDTLSGSFIYVPFENYNGVDLFRFSVNDGTYDSNISEANITINPVNDDPFVDSVLVDLYLYEDFEDTLREDLRGIFEDVDGELTFALAFEAEGVVSGAVVGDTMLTLTSIQDANGVTEMYLTASNPTRASVTDTILITIYGENDAPVLQIWSHW